MAKDTRKTRPKLKLSRETIRVLQDAELSAVAGAGNTLTCDTCLMTQGGCTGCWTTTNPTTRP